MGNGKSIGSSYTSSTPGWQVIGEKFSHVQYTRCVTGRLTKRRSVSLKDDSSHKKTTRLHVTDRHTKDDSTRCKRRLVSQKDDPSHKKTTCDDSSHKKDGP